MYDSFFQYRAIRIKTAKGINPVRINKTLVQFAHFIFPQASLPVPSETGNELIPIFRIELDPVNDAHCHAKHCQKGRREDGWLCATG